jgi:hypothetical protein
MPLDTVTVAEFIRLLQAEAEERDEEWFDFVCRELEQLD